MSNVAESLRAIVADYYHGLLTFDSYREQRGKLLDALQLEARRPPAEIAEPTAPAPSSEETRTNVAARAPAPAPAPTSVATAPEPKIPTAPLLARKHFAVVAGASAAVVAVIVVALVLLRGGDSAAPEPAANATQPAELPPGAALLEQFMQSNIWSPDSVRTLERSWQSALTEEQRQTVRSAPTYTRFADLLRRRIRGEEALSAAQPSEVLESLVSLARGLEMPYAASLTLPAQGVPPQRAAEAAIQDDTTELAPAAQGEVAAPAPATQPDASAPATERTERAPVVNRESGAAAASAPPAVATPAPAPAPASPPAGSAQVAAQGDANPECSAELLNTRRPYCRDHLRDGTEGPALAILPAGRFVMGGDQPNEGPPHDVTIAASIAMSVYEISFAEFSAYCTSTGAACPENPWGSTDSPVVQVSWSDAVAYTEWLSADTGHRYRLPSEAEWEYAARAGTTTPYPFGDQVTPSAARSSANGAVDSPLANSDRSVNRNAFRLFHMIGNVREWVADEWHADYAGAPADGSARVGAATAPRAVRGGAYADVARLLRSAARSGLPPETRDRFTGFRVVRALDD